MVLCWSDILLLEESVETSPFASEERRRSTRIERTILLTVRGIDTSRSPYVERVPTLILSCHGCCYRSKHEVILGNLVLLEINGPNQGALDSTQARIKWLRETKPGEEKMWDVAVELETPGNFWGLETPPNDWTRTLESRMSSLFPSGQELQVEALSEQLAGRRTNRVTHLSAIEAMPTESAPGFNGHLERVASQALMAVLINEKQTVLGQFRAQLQEEMTQTLNRVVGSCKGEMVHNVLSEIREVLDDSVRSTQENWDNKIEEGLNSATARMTAQAVQAKVLLEDMASQTIEQLRREMNLLRLEMMDQVKIESLQVCKLAEDFLQKSEQQFARHIQERSGQSKCQFEGEINLTLARAGGDLDSKSAELLDQTRRALTTLSEGYQQTTQGKLEDLAALAAERVLNILNDQAAEVTKKSLSQLQGCTHRYLENVSRSLAELSQKPGIDR